MKFSVVLAGWILAGTALAQPEQWLQYHTATEAPSRQWLEVTSNAPPGVALPPLNAQPLFVRWETPLDPSGGRWICLDRTRKPGSYRVYVDSNGNSRLDDETALTARRTDGSYTYFDAARVVFKGEDGPITYHLSLQVYSYENDTELLIGSGGWYEGTVNLDGKKTRLQLFDGNVNGAFNDQAPNGYSSDRVVIGDGKEETTRYLGKMIEVNGQLFRIEVARDGAFVKIWKAEDVELGPVRLPETISEFTVYGPNGHFTRKPEKGGFTLPTGHYRILDWEIERKDDKGSKWVLSGSGFGDAGAFEVAAAKPADLVVGEPIRTFLQMTERTNRQVHFSLNLRGPLGERIGIQKGSQRAPGPKLTVATLDGQQRYTNTFEYG